MSYNADNSTDGIIRRRFWPHVEKLDDCWLWTGALDSYGYGLIGFWKRPDIKAHRLSWEIHRGTIPAGLSVLHRCDIRRCVNPAHLFLGTQTDNMHDAENKGRLNFQINPRQHVKYAKHLDGHRPHGEQHGQSKLTVAKVKEIRRRASSGVSIYALSRQLDVPEQTLRDVITKHTWAHVQD